MERIVLFILSLLLFHAVSSETSTPSNSGLSAITCWKEPEYSQLGCYCFMDYCLEHVRYVYLQEGLPLPVVSSNEAVANETIAKETTIEADMVNTNVTDVNTTEETTAVSTTTQLYSLYDLIEGSDIVVKKLDIQPAQWGVNIGQTISLCDCSNIFPEIVNMSVVISNKIWNPLLSDQRTAQYREAKRVIETEVQLLINSTEAKVSKNRAKQIARQNIEIEVKEFLPFLGYTRAHLDINMTESHFDNHIAFENHFMAAVRRYNNFTGIGVFGKIYRGYQKSYFDVQTVTCRRDLPEDAKVIQEAPPAEEAEEDPMIKLMM